MTAPAFAAVTIPAGTLRRRWLRRTNGEVSTGLEIARLLRQINPNIRPDPYNAGACYMALIRIVSQKFPVSEYWMDEIESIVSAFHWGIPIEPVGYMPYNGGPALGLTAATLGLFDTQPDATMQKRAAEVFHDLAHVDLRWWAGPLPELNSNKWRTWKIKPGRGRTWAGVWAGLPDMCDYLLQRTENPWLDYSVDGLEESGFSMPPWNIEEIRALERMWNKAAPIKTRIDALTAKLDADGVRGLKLLDRVLRGEAQAVQSVTEPKAGHGRTLAEIWS